jgi:hypothetical protein
MVKVESWISRKIGRGQILLEKDPCYKCYLFPRTRSAVGQLKQLKSGKVLQVSFPKEHCDPLFRTSRPQYL